MAKETIGTLDRPLLHEVKPREVVGRDTIARYQAQFRAASLACLAILSGKSIDRVFCDYQDDFVTRQVVDGLASYCFYQVKTNKSRNHQWSRAELFGLVRTKRKATKTGEADDLTPEERELRRIADSFVGKLLDHTVRFGSACEKVSFLTNVSFDNDVETVAVALEAGDLSNEVLAALVERFNAIFQVDVPFTEEEASARVKKLELEPGLTYLNVHDHDFESKAAKTIYEYSEVDLTQSEGEEIAKELVQLVELKSHKKLMSQATEADLNDASGIGIDDLLEILSISKGAYQLLLSGGDSKALKTVSIIQRKLDQAGASEPIVEAASRWKLEWDNWLRLHRHIHDAEISFLLMDLHQVHLRWARGEFPFSNLGHVVKELLTKYENKTIAPLLTEELLLGGVFAALVRSEAR